MSKNIDINKYEEVWDFKLPPHMTTIIRVDGKNFSRVTSHLNKPFDAVFNAVMDMTVCEVAKEIQGCKLAYCQSDEASFIVTNVEDQTPYFNGRLQKIASIVAAKMSVCFYKNFMHFILEYQNSCSENTDKLSEEDIKIINDRISNLWKVLDENPIFDARCFVIPAEEDILVLKARQKNAENNSILAVGQHYLGKKTVENLKRNDIVIRLMNAGYLIEDVLLDRDRYGSIIFKDEENGWISTTATDFSSNDVYEELSKIDFSEGSLDE